MNFLTKTTLLFLLLIQGIYAQKIESKLTKVERPNDGDVIENYFDANLAPFYHGVASGDPLEDAVIIWTRVTTNESEVTVKWNVATDAGMQNVIKSGSFTTNQERDYTIKVDVKGLEASKKYYYQFEALGATSIIGQTKTTPKKETLVDNLRFAVVSCSNYQQGYFNAYNQIAKRNDIDAVIHLGDYIYEYESGGYGYSKKVGRGHLPTNEIITLNDYRVRYSFYRLDPMLRNVHQNHPFINIWDDHEFANDANKYGAQNHTEKTEGPWEVRKGNAHKAYFEWMPIRANSIEEYRLYRKISYGKLVDLIMLDTRIEGRDTQIESSKNLVSAAGKNAAFKSYVTDVVAKKDMSNRADVKEVLTDVLPLLVNVSDATIAARSTQNNSLNPNEFKTAVDLFTELVVTNNIDKLENSEAKELEKLLEKGIKYSTTTNEIKSRSTYKSILGQEQFSWLVNNLKNSEARWKVIGNQVMLMPWNGIPSNDAWDGYKEERNRLLRFMKENSIKNTIVLTGDIHCTFVGEVEYEKECQLCEFVTPSINSTNLEVAGKFLTKVAESYTKTFNKHIKDLDLDNHGYFILDVREDQVQADWFDTPIIDKPSSTEEWTRSWFVNYNDCRVKKNYTPSHAIKIKGKKDKIVLETSKIINPDNNKNDFVVMGVYPNPIQKEEGNIHYIVNRENQIIIGIYNFSGQLVQEIQNETVAKGIYNLSFNAGALEPGNYIIQIATKDDRATRKIVVK